MSAGTDHRISDPAGRVLAEPAAYADETRLQESLAHLRKHAPVSWVETGDYRPFWAITKHADIMDIERDNALFTNFPRPLLAIAEADDDSSRLRPISDVDWLVIRWRRLNHGCWGFNGVATVGSLGRLGSFEVTRHRQHQLRIEIRHGLELGKRR